jgi:hypothetical protein
LLKIGASLDVRVGQQQMTVTDSSKLPAERFSVVVIDLDPKVEHRKGTDALLALVKKNCPDVERISFAQTDATNAGMEQLRGLTKLTSVFCEGTAIDDRGFAALADLKDLRDVWVGLTQIGNDGAKVLAGLPELRLVRAYYTRIDDGGLAAL